MYPTLTHSVHKHLNYTTFASGRPYQSITTPKAKSTTNHHIYRDDDDDDALSPQKSEQSRVRCEYSLTA